MQNLYQVLPLLYVLIEGPKIPILLLFNRYFVITTLIHLQERKVLCTADQHLIRLVERSIVICYFHFVCDYRELNAFGLTYDVAVQIGGLVF